jgi:hypothetical protein
LTQIPAPNTPPGYGSWKTQKNEGRAGANEDFNERSAISVVVGREMMSLRDIVAGILIGPANQTWFEVLVSSVGWGFVAWLLVVFVTGRASYKPDSPALTRFIVWWTIAAGTSLVIGSIVFAVRQVLK